MRTVRLRRLLASVDNGAWGNEPGGSDVDVQCVRAADFDFDALRVDLTRAPLRGVDQRTWSRLKLRPGDLVLEKSGGGELAPVGRAVLFDKESPAITSNFAARVVPQPWVDPRFLVYTLRSLYDRGVTLQCIKQTTGIQNLDTEHWLNSGVPAPPTEDQRRIADFLDDRVARIDRIIAARIEQTSLLSELIAETERNGVAGLLPGGNRVNPAAIPWLGAAGADAIPITLSRVVTLQRGVDLTDEERRPGEVPVVTTAGVVGMHDKAIAAGPGVVIGRYGSVGNVHWLDGPYWPHNTTLYVKNRMGNDLRWIYYLLRSFPYEAMQARAAVPGVNRNDLARELIPWIPVSRQLQIVHWLDHELEKLSDHRRDLARSISNLRDYKSSLITAAVTGELDVRTAGSGITG